MVVYVQSTVSQAGAGGLYKLYAESILDSSGRNDNHVFPDGISWICRNSSQFTKV
jgi:hypothetical protein